MYRYFGLILKNNLFMFQIGSELVSQIKERSNNYQKYVIISIIRKQMCQQQNQSNMCKLVPNLIMNLIGYLTEEQLEKFAQAMQINSRYVIFQKIIKTKLIFLRYLNKGDRSYYLQICNSNDFIGYENSKIIKVALSQNYQIFTEYYNNFINLLQLCQNSIDQQLRKEFLQKIKNIFINPDLPTPKLHRETSAHVESSFQNFLLCSLVTQDYGQCNVIHDQVFENFETRLLLREQQYIRSMIKNYGIMKDIIGEASTIQFNNIQSKLIGGNQFHNVIVYLLAITELHLRFVQLYLSTIEEPFQLFLQLILKYIQFNNTVIAIEQNLGFLFKNYEEFYNELFGQQFIKFTYWKSALAMWISKMKKFHKISNNIYASLLHQDHNKYTRQLLLSQKYEKIDFQLFQNPPSNEPDNIHYKNYLYQLMKSKEQNQINILVSMYKEYLVDISIDQQSVHQCGYSRQQLDQIFVDAQEVLIDKEGKFIKNLRNGNFNDEESLLVQQVLQARMMYCESNVKPCTFRAYLDIYNKQGIGIQASQFEAKDKIIEHFINYNKRNLKSKGNSNLFHTIKNKGDDGLSDTSDNSGSINLMQFYDSENEMEDEKFPSKNCQG